MDDAVASERGPDVCVRAARGERDALFELYEAHHAYVRAFARRLVGDEALGEDLVHEVFLALPKALRSFRGACSVRSYLVSLAAKRARRWIRTAARRRASRCRRASSSMPSAYTRWGAGVPISEDARRAFSRATCNGCHAGERPADTLRFQHLAPWDAPGPYYRSDTSTVVSTYLNDPSGGEDELGRRAKHAEALLCAAACNDAPRSTETSSPSYDPPRHRACP